MSESQFKNKARGNEKDISPDKRDLNDDLDMSDKDILLMKEAFDALDIEGTGVVSKATLEATLGLLKEGCEIGEKMLKGLTSLEKFDFNDFVKHIDVAKGNPRTRQGVDSIFNLIGNEEENIDFDCLKKLVVELGDTMSDEELRNNMERLAPGKGFITKEQFRRLMRPRRG
jgi:Ca2+-binding EF-hand superfamily protein